MKFQQKVVGQTA